MIPIMMTLYISLLIYLKYLEIRQNTNFISSFQTGIVCAGHRRCTVHDTERYFTSASDSETVRTGQVPPGWKTIYYSLADDHVATIMAQGLEHVCE